MTNTCKWLSDDWDEICCNAACPACTDWCPAVNYPGLCKYEEPKESPNAPKRKHNGNIHFE